MRSNYTRRRSRYVARENNSFWLTFSDLMSSLLLVFILVMFYSVYQYFDMLELKTAELMRQSGMLTQREEELNQLSSELSEKNDELVSSQGKLTESEQALATQQYQLMLTRQAQEEAEKSLADQRKDLDDALALLASRETDLDAAKKMMDMKEEDLAAAKVLLETKEEDLAAAKALLESNQKDLADARLQMDSQTAKLSEQQSMLQSQQSMLQNQQSKLDELVGVRARIVQSLASELKAANVKAKVDEKTGSIALDASVMFDVGKFDLKDSGKAVLDQFLPVYLGVLMEAENRGNISEIIIEGHTDSVGSYMSNLKLSQERALAVMEYMLSDENTMLSRAMKEQLRKIGTANGRSFSMLVRRADGREDAQASRRVEFKFRMQDEQMIQSMRDILDDMNKVYPSNPTSH